MRLSNGVNIYCKSMRKIFRVAHIAKTADEANAFMANHSDTGLIAEDQTGLLYIAELYSMTVPSSVLPD